MTACLGKRSPALRAIGRINGKPNSESGIIVVGCLGELWVDEMSYNTVYFGVSKVRSSTVKPREIQRSPVKSSRTLSCYSMVLQKIQVMRAVLLLLARYGLSKSPHVSAGSARM